MLFEEIRAGGQTRTLDLKGERRRAIKEIEMVYRSQPSFKGQATVCVDGQLKHGWVYRKVVTRFPVATLIRFNIGRWAQ